MSKFVYLKVLLVLQLGQLCNCQCEDVAPDELSSCSQQKEWGKCDRQWMKKGNFCAATCGRCTTPTPTPTPTPPSKPTLECEKGDEIFRSSVVDGDCSGVCRAIDICNAWVMCKSLSGCTLRGKPLLQNECTFQTSSTDPTTTAIDGGGEMLFFSQTQEDAALTNTGPISQTQLEDEESTLEQLQDINDTSTFVELASSKNLDSELKVNIADPDFVALLCIPTNDAFEQFFDESGLTSDDLQSDPEAVTQLMKQNIIPGKVGFPQIVGESSIVPSLLKNSSMTVERLPDKGIKVFTEAMEIPAIKTQDPDIGGPDLKAWVLDQVLVPPQFTVEISVSNKSIQEFVQGQPAKRLFAPTDKVFNQYFEKHQIVLEDFLEQDQMLEQVMNSLLVDDLDLDEKQVFKSDIWNPVQPQISLKAELSNQDSVWVINNLYPKQKQIQ